MFTIKGVCLFVISLLALFFAQCNVLFTQTNGGFLCISKSIQKEIRVYQYLFLVHMTIILALFSYTVITKLHSNLYLQISSIKENIKEVSKFKDAINNLVNSFLPNQ